jgi:hypothetical protein
MLNEDPHALNGWTGGSRSASEIVSPTPQRCQQWANLIHDQVLQSLGLCALQADLCRRLWETGQET